MIRTKLVQAVIIPAVIVAVIVPAVIVPAVIDVAGPLPGSGAIWPISAPDGTSCAPMRCCSDWRS
jgi:hypothetical protein